MRPLSERQPYVGRPKVDGDPLAFDLHPDVLVDVEVEEHVLALDIPLLEEAALDEEYPQDVAVLVAPYDPTAPVHAVEVMIEHEGDVAPRPELLALELAVRAHLAG